MNISIDTIGKLFMELSIQTDQTTGEIVSIAYPIMEAMKSTGQNFDGIKQAFYILESSGLIERLDQLEYKMTTKGLSISSHHDLKKIIN